MSTIKQFNQILNASDKNRFEFWKPYRHSLTSFILECMDDKHYHNLIILGAGNLDDIDLDALSYLFNTITLSDIDRKALENAKNKYKLASQKVTLKEMEYTGLKDSDHWNNFITNMISCTSEIEIKAYFSLLKKEIDHHRFALDDTYDVVIVTPIYTQLLLQQALKDISILASLNYPKHLLEYIKTQTLEMMPTVIQTFNNNLSRLLTDKAVLCVVSDIFEANIDSDFYHQVTTILNDMTKMNNFYSTYVQEFGMGVGDYGIEHLLESYSIKQIQWIEWPFTLDKSIFIKAGCLQKK